MTTKGKIRIATEIIFAAGAASAFVRAQLVHPGTMNIISGPTAQVQAPITAPEFVAEMEVDDGIPCDLVYQGITSDGQTAAGPFRVPNVTPQVAPAPPAA